MKTSLYKIIVNSDMLKKDAMEFIIMSEMETQFNIYHNLNTRRYGEIRKYLRVVDLAELLKTTPCIIYSMLRKSKHWEAFMGQIIPRSDFLVELQKALAEKSEPEKKSAWKGYVDGEIRTARGRRIKIPSHEACKPDVMVTEAVSELPWEEQ